MITFDREYVNKFRPFSILSRTEMKIGETYYHYNGKPFILEELITKKESWRRCGMECNHLDADEIGWFVTNTRMYKSGDSLQDHGIDVSEPHNPWLIFKDQTKALEYKSGLVIGDDGRDKDYFFDPT